MTDTRLQREFIDKLFQRHLTPRERKILSLYYGLEEGSEALTLEKIGALLGVTRERIRQIRERAFEKLRDSAGRAGAPRVLGSGVGGRNGGTGTEQAKWRFAQLCVRSGAAILTSNPSPSIRSDPFRSSIAVPPAVSRSFSPIHVVLFPGTPLPLAHLRAAVPADGGGLSGGRPALRHHAGGTGRGHTRAGDSRLHRRDPGEPGVARTGAPTSSSSAPSASS